MANRDREAYRGSVLVCWDREVYRVSVLVCWDSKVISGSVTFSWGRKVFRERSFLVFLASLAS